MRRLTRLLLYAGTAGAVVGLSKLHAVWHEYDYTGSFRFAWSLAYVMLLVVAAYGLGLPELARTWRGALVAAVSATVVSALGISLLQLLVGSLLLPRFTVLVAPLVLIPWYVLCARLASEVRSRGEERDRVVVVAALEDVEHLREELRHHPERPADLVAALSPEAAATFDLATKPLIDTVNAMGATVVVLDRQAQSEDAIVSQAAVLHESGVRVRTLSLFYDEWLGKLPVTELERVALMFDIGELHRARYNRFKRVLDVLVGVMASVAFVLALPLVAFGNLMANRGPLFFSQPRMGKNGETFSILKFRTMRPSDDSGTWTAADDPRVTRFGAVLRRMHLDELPQCVNVLRGDLSVVGPRPEQPHYVAELADKIPFYDLRHLVRPGLTGWAQVKYGYAGSEADAVEKLQYEFYYLRHQGMTLDLRIVGRTVRSVIRQGGR
jgi:exopolysaccharide biosynthesis polyprenyl glycosylphosphotransferase